MHGTPTTFALEEAVAQLEGGHAAVALPSGLAAIVAALAPFAKTGRAHLMVDSVYGPTRNFCEKRLKPFGVEVEYYDPLIGGAIAKLIRPNTTAVYCEAPGSLTFEMQDLPAIAAAAHAKNIPVLADNTWGTPYFFPLVRARRRRVDPRRHQVHRRPLRRADGAHRHQRKILAAGAQAVADYGYCVSPDDCYLALRGLAHDRRAHAPSAAKRAQDRALAAGAPGSAARAVSGARKRSRPRAVEARLQRRGVAVRRDPETGARRSGRRHDRRARTLRHRLELGRLRKPAIRAEPGQGTHGDEMESRRAADPPAYRAGRPRRSDRRSRTRVGAPGA